MDRALVTSAHYMNAQTSGNRTDLLYAVQEVRVILLTFANLQEYGFTVPDPD